MISKDIELNRNGTTVIMRWVKHGDTLINFGRGTRIVHIAEFFNAEAGDYQLRIWLLVPKYKQHVS